MNFKLLKVGLLCAALGLASCGGSSDSSTATSTTAAATTVIPNTGTVTVTTLPNNVVSIGALGTNYKTADAAGKAVFTGVTPGAVDVHVFSADGYAAISYMGVNTATVMDTTFGGQTGGSVIDVYVSVVNADIYGQTLFLHTADNDYTGFWSSFSGTGTINLYDKPVGSVVLGTLYIGQGAPTSSAGNAIGRAAGELVNLGSISLTTQPANTGNVQQNFTATFPATPVTPPLLATVQSIIPPTGLSVLAVAVGSAYISPQAPATSVVLPDTINAADIGNYTWFTYTADAASTKQWGYQAPFTVGASLTASSTLNAFPTVVANQTGSTISWTNPVGSWSSNSMQVFDALHSKYWTVVTAPSISSITLPTVPAVAVSPLVVGTAYQVNVGNTKYSGDFALAVSNPNAISGSFESISTTNVAYTR